MDKHEMDNTTDNTGSRSGYDSTAEKAQGETKRVTGALMGDKEWEGEGGAQVADAEAVEDEILEPWTRARSAEEAQDNTGT